MSDEQKSRVAWRATLLSLLMPGLGQVYNGQVKKGLLILILLQPGLLLTSVPILLLSPIAPLNIVIPALIVLSAFLYIYVDAYKTARRLGSDYQLKAYNKWYVYIGVYIGAYLLAWFIQPVIAHSFRSSVIQAFKIPSGAMEQTILIGDHFLVNKFIYRLAPPKRADIIVFRYPWKDDRDWIKRVVGLPGDRVEVRDQQVYVNERTLQEPYAQYTSARIGGNFGPIIVPKKGDTVEIRQDNHLYLNGQRLDIPTGRYYPRDYGPAMTGFEVFYAPLFPVGTTLNKPTGPLVVQHDYYFTLGDHRDNSKDSRYWGFVEDTRIKGKAVVIYWSWNRHAKGMRKVRWGRIGMRLDG